MADGSALPRVSAAAVRTLLGWAVLGWLVLEALLVLAPAPLWVRTGCLFVVQIGCLTAAVLTSWARRSRETGRGRVGWGLIALGLAIVAVANVTAAFSVLALQDLSPTLWRDAISGLGVLVFGAGLLALCGSAPLTSRGLSLIDTVMAAGACLFVVSQTLLTDADSLGGRQQQVLYSYLGGMALVLMLALLFAARWRGDGRTLTFLGAGLGFEMLTLVGLAVLSSQGHAVPMSDPAVGSVFPLGTALLAVAAAQRPTGPTGWVPMRRQWDIALGVPLASGVTVALTALGSAIAGHTPAPPMLALAVLVVVLLFVRQGLTLLENRRLTLGLERVVAERTAELEESRRYFRDVVQHSSDLITVLSSDGRLTYASPAVTAMLGYQPEELVGTSALDRVHVSDTEAVGSVIGNLSTVVDGTVFACRVRHKDGSWRSVEATLGRGSVVDGDQTFIVNVRDVTERQLLEERLRYQAYHDPLTGLANRTLIQDRMRHALLRARRTHESTALVYVDLDEFKRLNDTAGHTAGDEALVHVADVIRSCIRPHDTAARLGGDEFAVLLEDADEGEGERVADRIVAALRQLPIPHQRAYVSGASVGVSVSNDGRADGESLLRDADIAMYQAKSSGRGRSAVFHPGMRERLVRELALESGLRTALEEGALHVEYQPIIDLATRRVAGVEALVRWRDQHGKLIPPSLFIPLAEQVGLIGALDRWVLGQACQDLADLPVPTLNVNLSARDLDEDVQQWVADAIGASGLDPRRLMLEITETAVLPDLGALAGTLEALRHKGIRISLDDFGTGYSSMASLRQLPLDEIKIDGSFVAGLPESESASRVVEGIIAMARSMGIPVVAEAVESPEQAAHLTRFRCDYAQGWLYAEPMPAPELEQWVRARDAIAV